MLFGGVLQQSSSFKHYIYRVVRHLSNLQTSGGGLSLRLTLALMVSPLFVASLTVQDLCFRSETLLTGSRAVSRTLLRDGAWRFLNLDSKVVFASSGHFGAELKQIEETFQVMLRFFPLVKTPISI
ncbi:hypothetical protein Q8A73_022834 [Channa argus]|nr:hypothetical protein Q8A73_022834 [Channa argus]